jgi:hypothetical protein
MRLTAIIPVLKWVLALSVLAGILGLAYLAHQEAREERKKEAQEGKDEKDDDDDARKALEKGVVKLRPEQVQKVGLQDVPVRETKWRPRLTLYGRVIPNPRATTEVRAAFAGTLRADPGLPWPGLGSLVEPGMVLGWIDVRVGPQERLDLLAKLREAQLKEQGTEEVVKVQQERLDRLGTAAGGLSRAELDAAKVQLVEARTQLAVARAAVKAWEKALQAIDNPGPKDSTWRQPILVPAGGEITALAGQPGMAMQAGDLIARVVDFRRVLARLDFPAAALAAGPPPALDLFASATADEGEGEHISGRLAPQVPRLKAAPVCPAPQVDPASQLVSYWYESQLAVGSKTNDRAGVWRPGLFVKAYLPLASAKPREALAVPLTSLLYFQGKPVVFVRAAPGTYVRREVRVLGREGDDWILAEGVQEDQRVVSRRAQVLLSQAVVGQQADKDDD